MNNKFTLDAIASIPKTVGGNLAWKGSGQDELHMFSEDITLNNDPATSSTAAEISTLYVPENLSNSPGATIGATLTRQDIKRRLAQRLPRVTLGQGLVILSDADQFAQYFINSFVYFNGHDYVRWGIANFTADQATNPFAEGQQGTLNAVWAFFDIVNP